MKYKKSIYLLLFLIINIGSANAQSQLTIELKEGYSPQIGVIVSMLEDLKSRVTSSVENLDQKGVDFLLDKESNRIGAMILHLAATEKYYQVRTFENRKYNEEESMKWDLPLGLGEKARDEILGKPIGHYLNIWNEVRGETLELLKSKDDEWLNSKTKGLNMNNHWAWYHVMEHQGNHMGQIRLISKRIPE